MGEYHGDVVVNVVVIMVVLDVDMIVVVLDEFVDMIVVVLDVFADMIVFVDMIVDAVVDVSIVTIPENNLFSTRGTSPAGGSLSSPLNPVMFVILMVLLTTWKLGFPSGFRFAHIEGYSVSRVILMEDTLIML